MAPMARMSSCSDRRCETAALATTSLTNNQHRWRWQLIRLEIARVISILMPTNVMERSQQARGSNELNELNNQSGVETTDSDVSLQPEGAPTWACGDVGMAIKLLWFGLPLIHGVTAVFVSQLL